MSRIPRRLAASLALLSAAAIALAACSSTPSLPALTDPNEIITAALKATEGATSVHLDVTVDGSITVDLTGTGGTGTPLSLTGTTATADVDMAGGKAHATFAVPAFLNVSGELIQIGETSYVKTSLTGPQYEVQQATDSLPVDPTDASGIFDDVGDFLTADGVDPVKGDDVDCGGKSCYTVSIELTADELAALGAGQAAQLGLPVDLGSASLSFVVRVEKDTYHLAGFKTVASLGEQGSLTLDLTLSRWDQPMDISAPPADQVKAPA
jgi:LppX_LprAFG lipoprotein